MWGALRRLPGGLLGREAPAQELQEHRKGSMSPRSPGLRSRDLEDCAPSMLSLDLCVSPCNALSARGFPLY